MYSYRARCKSGVEYFAQVSRPLTTFTATSAWPFLDELVLWSKCHSLANSADVIGKLEAIV